MPSLTELLAQPSRICDLGLPEWDATLRSARHHNLMSRLAWLLDRDGLTQQVPDPVRPHLVAASRLMDHQLQAIHWECRHLEAALTDLDTPMVLLKGAAYVMAGRRAALGRLFGDVDLLVPRESLNQVEAALMLNGWSTGAIDPYDQRYYRQWMHELPPMAHQGRGTVVDVHHNILPLTAADMPDAALLINDSVALANTRFRALSLVDMVIHSAVHLFHEGESRNGLRDLFDLDSLLTELTENDPGQWATLLGRARQLGLNWPVYLALRYCDRVIGTPVPAATLEESARNAKLGAMRLRWLDFMYQHAFTTGTPGALSFPARVSHSALFVRAHALRMPLGKLSLHLGRKAVLRLFKRSSRSQ